MAARATADHPEETCGFVFGAERGSQEVWPMRNIQNELHAAQPAVYPRDATRAYAFDGEEMRSVLAAKKAAGQPLVAIYHSHPDCAAYFSKTDSEAATVFGEPTLPGIVHLVLSVLDGEVADVKAFDWSSDAGEFVEVPLEIGD